MLLKTQLTATLTLLLLLVTGCRSVGPWRDDPPRPEVNFIFVIENNLLRLPSVEINGRTGRYFLGSAHPRSVFDPSLVAALGTTKAQLHLTARESLRLSPVPMPLGNLGDAIIGSEAWSSKVLMIDYHAGLITYQKHGSFTSYMAIHHFHGEPSIDIEVGGRRVEAIVDTALPDALVMPRGNARAGRTRATVRIGQDSFEDVDIALADVSRPRIGNLLLSHYLVSIDYGRREVGLWRDPRNQVRGVKSTD